MCWCDPHRRTPQCDSPNCHPPRQKLTEKLADKIDDHPENCRCTFCNRKRLGEIMAKVAERKLGGEMLGK